MADGPAVTPWIVKPRPVALAETFCYVSMAVLCLPLMFAAGLVLEPQGSASRREALAWTTLGVVAIVALALLARGIAAARPWGWSAATALGAVGLLGGAGAIVASVVAIVRMADEPVTGANIGLGFLVIGVAIAAALCVACAKVLRGLATPEARRWFSA